MDTQGSLTHIAAIFKFGDVSGPRAKKWPKVNHRLKIVNYFTCMWHFSCRWYGPPEVDLNWYPRICNPYCCNIQIQRCEWTQGKKMTQSKLQIKEVKEALVATHHTFTTTYFDNMWDNMWVQFFLGEKINEYFWYHPEIFLGVFYDNLC